MTETGYPVRILRDGKLASVDIGEMTDAELDALLDTKDVSTCRSWAKALACYIRDLPKLEITLDMLAAACSGNASRGQALNEIAKALTAHKLADGSVYLKAADAQQVIFQAMAAFALPGHIPAALRPQPLAQQLRARRNADGGLTLTPTEADLILKLLGAPE